MGWLIFKDWLLFILKNGANIAHPIVHDCSMHCANTVMLQYILFAYHYRTVYSIFIDI